MCSGPGGRQSRNPQPPGQPRPLGVPGMRGGGPGSVSAKHVPPGGLLRPTLLPERGAESTPGAVRPPRADGLGTLGTVTFLPHAQPVPPTRPFKPPPKRQGRPVHKEVRSARLLDSSATRQHPKTPARTPASVSSHSRSQPPGPGGPCRSRNMDYSLERTSSSRFSSCSCRCRSSPWFSMTQSKSPKSSRPHSDSTSSTPAEEHGEVRPAPCGRTPGRGRGGRLTADEPQGHCVYCTATAPSVPGLLLGQGQGRPASPGRSVGL